MNSNTTGSKTGDDSGNVSKPPKAGLLVPSIAPEVNTTMPSVVINCDDIIRSNAGICLPAGAIDEKVVPVPNRGMSSAMVTKAPRADDMSDLRLVPVPTRSMSSAMVTKVSTADDSEHPLKYSNDTSDLRLVPVPARSMSTSVVTKVPIADDREHPFKYSNDTSDLRLVPVPARSMSTSVVTKVSTSDDREHPFKYSNDTSDLRLVVEGRPLYVSRVVLSLASPVLKTMLQTRGRDNSIELSLEGKRYKDMVLFLGCIYPDTLAPITEENVEVVLHLAVEFEAKKLIKRCENFLIQDLQITTPRPRPEKVVRYLRLSNKCNLDPVQKVAFEAASAVQSDLIENVHDFWELPSVATTTVFISRVKNLEQELRNMQLEMNETGKFCELYHTGLRCGLEEMCEKCFASIGKLVYQKIKTLY